MQMDAPHCADCNIEIQIDCTIRKCILCKKPLCPNCGNTTQFNIDMYKGKVQTICESCYKGIQPDPEQWDAQPKCKGF